jgi:large subunit ribosomal protein L21
VYAVISSGGKQARVEEGERLDVELLTPDDDGGVKLTPVLIVDGGTTLATPEQLGGAYVEAKVVGEAKGPKIKAMTYQAKARRRRRWGHRQHYTTIEITKIWTDTAVRNGGGGGDDASPDENDE